MFTAEFGGEAFLAVLFIYTYTCTHRLWGVGAWFGIYGAVIGLDLTGHLGFGFGMHNE